VQFFNLTSSPAATPQEAQHDDVSASILSGLIINRAMTLITEIGVLSGGHQKVENNTLYEYGQQLSAL